MPGTKTKEGVGMKTISKILLVCGIVGLLFVGFALSGGWPLRWELREHPLVRPLKVTKIDGLTLWAGGQPLVVGGVSPPSNPEQAATLARFLALAAAQGVEVDERAQLPSGHALRCELRVFHWCGNDPVAAHFEQLSLNELLVAFGLVELAPEVRSFTSPAALRLRAAAQSASASRRGEHPPTFSETGIGIFEAQQLKDVDLFARAEANRARATAANR